MPKLDDELREKLFPGSTARRAKEQADEELATRRKHSLQIEHERWRAEVYKLYPDVPTYPIEHYRPISKPPGRSSNLPKWLLNLRLYAAEKTKRSTPRKRSRSYGWLKKAKWLRSKGCKVQIPYWALPKRDSHE